MSDTFETKSPTRHSRKTLGIGFALGLLVGVGMLIGSWLTISLEKAPSLGKTPLVIPETALHAVATDSGETFAIATGPISEEVEGIFALDFLTGDLQCWVIDSRTNQIGGYFFYNVAADLGMDANPKNVHYLMVTGRTGLRGGGSTVRYSECVVYIANGVTGAVAGYGIPWNRNLASRGGPQKGPLMRVTPPLAGRAATPIRE